MMCVIAYMHQFQCTKTCWESENCSAFHLSTWKVNGDLMPCLFSQYIYLINEIVHNLLIFAIETESQTCWGYFFVFAVYALIEMVEICWKQLLSIVKSDNNDFALRLKNFQVKSFCEYKCVVRVGWMVGGFFFSFLSFAL